MIFKRLRSNLFNTIIISGHSANRQEDEEITAPTETTEKEWTHKQMKSKKKWKQEIN